MPNHTGPVQRDTKRSEIAQMLKVDVIELNTTAWVSPVASAPKKARSLRCFIDSLVDVNIFSTLDCK